MAHYPADHLEAVLASALVALSGADTRAKTLHTALVDHDGHGAGDNAELTGPLADTVAVLRELGDRIGFASGTDHIVEALEAADMHLSKMASALAEEAILFHANGDDLRAQLADRILSGVIDPAITIIAMVGTVLPPIGHDQPV